VRPLDGPRPTLLVATTNRGKREELAGLLRGAGVDAHVRSLDDVVPALPPVVEDGATLAENALKKARAAAAGSGWLSLADDSGLEVDALDGRPGVLSARFAREDATDGENNAALVAALEASGRAQPFAARFRCVLALVDPRRGPDRSHANDLLTEPRVSGSPVFPAWTVEGVCEGAIVRPPRGSRGFGYDPLFEVAGTRTTLAELDRDAKNRCSHRGRALAALIPLLVRVLAGERA
jgi:XTP/dITP diphosphohydrolase